MQSGMESVLAVAEVLNVTDRSGTIEEVREATDLVALIGEHVPLRPKGREHVGVCPFHDDQHPSFGVNTEGDFWHCFAGCGGGSVIDF